jgi:hypothetical protein
MLGSLGSVIQRGNTMAEITSTDMNSKQLLALIKLDGLVSPTENEGVGRARLVEMLQALPAATKTNSNMLLTRLEKHFPEAVLSSDEYLTLSFVERCIQEIIDQTSLDPELVWLVQRFAPLVALIAVAKGPAKLFTNSAAFAPIDLLCKNCLGWSSDLGVLGQIYLEKVENLLREVSLDPKTQKEELQQVKDFFQSEHKRYAEREALYTRIELDELETAAARDEVARIINAEMEGKKFPFFVVILLQGEWLDFIQWVLLKKGPDSKYWGNALKLTKMLVWSLQEHDWNDAEEQKKLGNIIKNLPSKARALDKQLDTELEWAENAIADAEAEYERILDGKPSECGEFSPVELKGIASVGNDVNLSDEIKRDINPGEWFFYEELDQESSRLKLILLWENKQLLFTNHNHKGAIAIGYADFCRSLASGKVRKLNPFFDCNTIVRNFVDKLLAAQQQRKIDAARKKQSDKEALGRQVEEAKKLVAAANVDLSQLSLTERKEALIGEIEEIRKAEAEEQHELLKQQQEELQKQQEAEKQLHTATTKVLELGKGAEVSISTDGRLIECKLLTRMASIDRYIFVDRDGVKAAEYNQQELVDLQMAGNLEVLSKGEEFEDTLASVVRGLREDRDRIFAEDEI